MNIKTFAEAKEYLKEFSKYDATPRGRYREENISPVCDRICQRYVDPRPIRICLGYFEEIPEELKPKFDAATDGQQIIDVCKSFQA